MGDILLQCSRCGNGFWIEEGEALEHKGDYICSKCEADMASAEPRERFEYKVESPSMQVSNLGDLLNERGAEGWELVNISQQGTLVFKRRYVE